MVRLGEVARVEARQVAPQSIDYAKPYIGLESIGRGGAVDESVRAEPGSIKSAKVAYDERHILYGKLRPLLGKVARPITDGVASTDIYPILPLPGIDRGYLAWFLLRPETIAWAGSRTAGVNLPRVSWATLRELEIPLPPLPEQQRIAAILDEADALRVTNRRMREGLDDLEDATFERDFADLGLQPTVAFRSIVASSKLGLVRSSKQTGADLGNVYVRMNAITREGRLELGDAVTTTVDRAELDNFSLRRGDFLFNTRNTRQLVGKSAVVRAIEPGAVFNNNILRVRFVDSVAPEFVARIFRSNLIQAQLEIRKAGTTSVFAIYARDLNSVQVPLPSRIRQERFSEFLVDVDSERAALRGRLESFDTLFASLQHRAFRGEL
ncbi:MAG: restriction endonuclease subunit S [Agromyces sp.]